MSQVKMFTTTWCAYCKAEKAWLKEKRIDFTEVDVEADQAAAEEMIKLSGQQGVPFTVITKDDGTQMGVLGFDPDRLSAALS